MLPRESICTGVQRGSDTTIEHWTFYRPRGGDDDHGYD